MCIKLVTWKKVFNLYVFRYQMDFTVAGIPWTYDLIMRCTRFSPISFVPKELNTATFSKEFLVAVSIVWFCCVFCWPDTTWQYVSVQVMNNVKMVTALVTDTGKKKSCTKQLIVFTIQHVHLLASVGKCFDIDIDILFAFHKSNSKYNK